MNITILFFWIIAIQSKWMIIRILSSDHNIIVLRSMVYSAHFEQGTDRDRERERERKGWEREREAEIEKERER